MYLSLISRWLIVVDPDSDLPIATLAQLLLQEGRPAESLELFDKSVELGRTEQELISAISYAEVPIFYTPRVFNGYRQLGRNSMLLQNILICQKS